MASPMELGIAGGGWSCRSGARLRSVQPGYPGVLPPGARSRPAISPLPKPSIEDAHLGPRRYDDSCSPARYTPSLMVITALCRARTRSLSPRAAASNRSDLGYGLAPPQTPPCARATISARISSTRRERRRDVCHRKLYWRNSQRHRNCPSIRIRQASRPPHTVSGAVVSFVRLGCCTDKPVTATAAPTSPGSRGKPPGSG